ncbi:MAG: 2-amino-4-hydroxy-6-hydroxymethyldihydropteridine diphosphokinase [Proteobacteria bacterium]|nr:2-amino-4-hydroxy-6-hydroxymethyldihydropteridine diphosphokinase [Pseudomonadota bacterium]
MTLPYVLSLGSNQGDKLQNLRYGLFELHLYMQLKNIKISSLYQSNALLPAAAPNSWNIDYYNISVFFFADYMPKQIMNIIKYIEFKLHRYGKREKWSPRVIDIDLLIAGDLIIDSELLKIPHPEMLNRDFVLLPSAEIAPNISHPITKKYIKDYAKNYVLSNNLRLIQKSWM